MAAAKKKAPPKKGTVEWQRQRAIAHGAAFALTIIREARRAGIPVSLAFALVEQESAFKNVFGHDPTIFVGAGTVTKAKVESYLKQRGHTRMQGVGTTQLTWWEFQDEAQKLGGLWKPEIQMRVAFAHLARQMKDFGRRDGIRRYNGSGPAAEAYATSVLKRMDKWHDILS
jgi:hypothetical protein